MALRKATPIRFTPRGLSDAFDATDTFLGACRDLQNWVFSRTNPELIVPRPGVTVMTEFPGFSDPGFVSLHIAVQPRAYGMLATSATPTFDEPFVYDVASDAFVAISGVTGVNVPSSPATTGAWRPPTAAVIGTEVIITHPGYSGAPNVFFGHIDISNPASPAYDSANTATHGLPSVPVAVANFNNRAYYACGNLLFYSDVLDPLTITNATQFLQIGDTADIIALVGLPVQTASGGIVSALLIFKEGGQIWQIRGDTALSNLKLSFVSLNLGTLAPRTCVMAAEGTYFIGTDGPYCIDTLGRLFPLRSNQNVIGSDVTEPFSNATTPSRFAGAYTGKVYRVCGDTIVRGQEVTDADYWFDTNKRRWNGIHTFPYDCASPYDNFFILSGKANPGKLYKSQAFADVNSVFTDDGDEFECLMTSSTLPKTADMNEKFCVEATQELAYLTTPSLAYNINALDAQGNTLGSFGIAPYLPGSLWGAFVWGVGMWSSIFTIPRVFNVNFEEPLVFQKIAWQVGVTADASAAVGTAFLRYQNTGYVNSPNP